MSVSACAATLPLRRFDFPVRLKPTGLFFRFTGNQGQTGRKRESISLTEVKGGGLGVEGQGSGVGGRQMARSLLFITCLAAVTLEDFVH